LSSEGVARLEYTVFVRNSDGVEAFLGNRRGDNLVRETFPGAAEISPSHLEAGPSPPSSCTYVAKVLVGSSTIGQN
jgi:hypothetical protein